MSHSCRWVYQYSYSLDSLPPQIWKVFKCSECAKVRSWNSEQIKRKKKLASILEKDNALVILYRG
jgi:hypothetical protein